MSTELRDLIGQLARTMGKEQKAVVLQLARYCQKHRGAVDELPEAARGLILSALEGLRAAPKPKAAKSKAVKGKSTVKIAHGRMVAR
jgi:inorganic pyrophosphatase